jgi:4-oxalocrotonate tautomerase family enzyme
MIEVIYMPIVNIETWPLEKERKPVIIKKITEVFTEMGIPAQAVTVVIHETELDNWGSAGEQHSVKFKDLKK